MLRQSTVKFPLRKRNPKGRLCDKAKGEDTENCEHLNEVNAKRVLFGNTSNCELPVIDENSPKCSPSPPRSKISLCRRNSPALENAKLAFHTSAPTRIVGRQKELREISDYLKLHVKTKKSTSLYISGAPGTGKTTSVIHILKSMDVEFKYVFVNCMTLRNVSSIYKSIATELKLNVSTKSIDRVIKRHLVTSTAMTVLVLDEIDHLDSKGQEVLYSLFEWPQLENSKFILIGIANALDLTDRILPRLQAFNYQPKLFHFNPYTSEQIIAILEDRVSEIQVAGPVIKPIALQLCARKIAASTGDVRKALNVCRRAVEITEQEMRQQLALKVTADDGLNPGSPAKKIRTNSIVDVKQISAVLNEVYGSRIQTSGVNSCSNEIIHLPVQQGMVLCTLVLMKKRFKPAEINIGKLHDLYRKVCRKKQMAEVSDTEFYSLCQLVENRGFVDLKKNKTLRLTKIILKVEESEVEHVLRDKTLLKSILSDNSILN